MPLFLIKSQNMPDRQTLKTIQQKKSHSFIHNKRGTEVKMSNSFCNKFLPEQIHSIFIALLARYTNRIDNKQQQFCFCSIFPPNNALGTCRSQSTIFIFFSLLFFSFQLSCLGRKKKQFIGEKSFCNKNKK